MLLNSDNRAVRPPRQPCRKARVPRDGEDARSGGSVRNWTSSFTRSLLLFGFLGASFTAFGQSGLPLQGAVGVQSGVSFAWSDTQSLPSDAATLESITIDGKRFSKFAVPSGYELTQPGLNPGDNIILQNGATLYNLQTDGLAGWDSAALQAFQSLNLNYYFTSFSNGEETCGNYPAVATTTAVQHMATSWLVFRNGTTL